MGIQYYTGVVSQHEQVILQREPQNRYDRNAVRVLNVRGEQVRKAVTSLIFLPLGKYRCV